MHVSQKKDVTKKSRLSRTQKLENMPKTLTNRLTLSNLSLTSVCVVMETQK